VLPNIRGATFVVLGFTILLAPAYREFVSRQPAFLSGWEMFSGKGLDLFEVRFERLGPDGKRVPIDYLSEFGDANTGRTPPTPRRLRRETDAYDIARRLCATDRSALYMRLRDATRAGWRVVNDGSQDMCHAKAKGGIPR
jgi:hypothetical protein